MVSVIKSMVLYGAIVAAFVIALWLLRNLLRWMGHWYLTRRKYQAACACFTAGGFFMLDPRSRIYRNYCLFRRGKIDAEAMRECIECSSMAYSNEGYELLQKINQVANRKEK
jgi:hypothetical protein